MNVFELRDRLVADYASYTNSFIKVRDERISAYVSEPLADGAFWPEPLLQLNPTFKPGGTIDDCRAAGILHRECARIFRIDKTDTDHAGRPLQLHEYQREAIVKSKEGKSYVLPSGTGSGKSLTYIIPIVRRKDEEKYSGDFRTKRVILEVYDAMQEAIRTGKPYHTHLDPPRGPPQDADGNFLSYAQIADNPPPHIHLPRGSGGAVSLT